MNLHKTSTSNKQQQHILILGAARQGLAAARYLLGQNVEVTINDQKNNEELLSTLESIRNAFPDKKLHAVLGQGHPVDLLDGKDRVCLSGGIPLTLPLVKEAQARGMALTNDSQLLMEAVPCKVIGITGSAGKTTTTTLVGRMLEAWTAMPGCPYHRSWVGGNIGNPLIEQVDRMQANDLVILELSSFQLEQMTISPDISAVLNVTPNHLDRHGTMEAYTAAKANILTHQTGQDWAILNREDPGSWGLTGLVKGNLATFGMHEPDKNSTGLAATYVQDDHIILANNGSTQILYSTQDILLPGEYNLMNVLAACTIAHTAGAPSEAMQAGINQFRGVAHRMEYIRQYKGADWYNNSIATAPERTLAVMRSFDQPLVLFLGGRDKNLDWGSLAQTILERADRAGIRHIILFGETAGKVIAAFKDQATFLGKPVRQTKPATGLSFWQIGKTPITQFDTLYDAVQFAGSINQPGDIVLLSPGGTSFDAFRDFEERGECFRKWVNQLA